MVPGLYQAILISLSLVLGSMQSVARSKSRWRQPSLAGPHIDRLKVSLCFLSWDAAGAVRAPFPGLAAKNSLDRRERRSKKPGETGKYFVLHGSGHVTLSLDASGPFFPRPKELFPSALYQQKDHSAYSGRRGYARGCSGPARTVLHSGLVHEDGSEAS